MSSKKIIQLVLLIFVGGNLAASAEILHRKANVDYCVIGDGEIIVQNLVKAIREKKTSDYDLDKTHPIYVIQKKLGINNSKIIRGFNCRTRDNFFNVSQFMFIISNIYSFRRIS